MKATCLALVVVALASTGCGGSSREVGGSTRDEAARAYVDAINARDGATVCDLMVDSAAYEFRIPEWGECPKFVSAFIGYQEDSGSEIFHRARLVEVHEGASEGELQSLNVTVEIERESGAETLEDVLWLVERDGHWRLARPSQLLYAAIGATSVPGDVLEAPDLAARERAYEQETTEEREEHEVEQASFGDLEDEVFDCGGTETSYDDVSHDLHFEGSRELTPDEADRYATADVRRVSVDTEGEDICVRVTLGSGRIEDLLLIRFDIYSPEKNPTYLGPELELGTEVQADGRARLAYEDQNQEDEYGRPASMPVPARLGREGDTFSFRVTRKDLLEVMNGRRLPDWDGFLWGGIIFYLVTVDGERRAVSDDVHGYLAMISHPGGRVFESGERQTRDLPTD